MHKLLTKWLAKRHIKSPEELDDTPMPDGSPTERQTFETYRQILSKDQLTLEDVKEFCQSQVSVIENKWKELSLENSKKAEMIPFHTVYKTLLQLIDGHKATREALEKQLEKLIQ